MHPRRFLHSEDINTNWKTIYVMQRGSEQSKYANTIANISVIMNSDGETIVSIDSIPGSDVKVVVNENH